MRTTMHPPGALLVIAALLGTAGCGTSPTSRNHAPVISQLQVGGPQRLSGSSGVLPFSFNYEDPEADIDRLVFDYDADDQVIMAFNGASQAAGTASVLKALFLRRPGTVMNFSFFVVDRHNNQSNTLNGTFVAP